MKIRLLYDFFSYNGPLPNGINLNYLYTFIKHGFKFNHITLHEFESKFEAISVWNDTHTIDTVVSDVVSISDLNLNRLRQHELDRDDIFLYIISPFGGASATYGYKMNYNEGKSFFYHMSETAINLIKDEKNVFLFINYSNEGTTDLSWFTVIHNDAKKFNIPLNKIVYCTSDYFIDLNYNIWKKLNNIDNDHSIKLLYLNWSLTDKAREFKNIYEGEKTSFNQFENQCSITKHSDISSKDIRSNKFLMLNRRLRPHRIYSICLFQEMKILDQMLISYDIDTMQLYDINQDNVKIHIDDDDLINTIINQFNYLKKENPKQIIDYDNLEHVWGFNFENKHPYIDSYIHITSETNFFELGGYFSEKTWKPIGHLQPFIFMGPACGLHELKKLGFKTFYPFIDESYDLEMDPEKRFKMIINEINRLSKLDILEIHNWYHTIYEDVILHNQKILFDYTSYDLEKKLVKTKFKQLFYDNTTIK